MHLASSISDPGLAALVVGLRRLWDGFTHDAGTMLITSIWQSAVIVCGLEIALRMMPRMSAAQRFAVWVAGFGVAVGLPLLPFFHFGANAAGAPPAETATASHALLQIDARWGLAIAGLWLLASAIRGTDLLVHSIRLRRLWKTARPVEGCEKLSSGLKKIRGGRVAICTTDKLDRPSVIGFFAPRILIPGWLIGRLTPGELEQILLHEAEHLRRRDDWTNLAQKIALIVFPLNPALAWMEHRLCRDREMACDEGVVRATNAPRAYAACLANLAEHGLERRAEALSLGAWHKRSELAHRVHGILLRKRGMSPAAAGALLGAVGCALLAATVEMARAPELVAFVPKQEAVAMTPARQQQMAAMLAQETADAKTALPAGYRAESTRAIVPQVHRGNQASGTKRGSLKSAASSPMKTSFENSGQVAKDDPAGGDRVNAGVEKQWIVLSTWEEVRTVSPASGSDQMADYDAAAPVNATQGNENAVQTGGTRSRSQARTSYAVMQLILRVAPADPASNSIQVPTGILRGGWFVIQL